MQGTPNYSIFKNNVPLRQSHEEHQWRSTMEHRFDSLYTEFRSVNSQIGELLAIVKTGMTESLEDNHAPGIAGVQDGCARRRGEVDPRSPCMYDLL
jgi:hypothetical protein